MDIEDYKERKKILRKDFEEAERLLNREFAFSNSTVKIGDTVTDHVGSIIVESIGVYLGIQNQFPTCYYQGLELNKDGKPKKNLNKRMVYQTNLKKSS